MNSVMTDAGRLYATRNDLPEEARRRLVAILNRRLADCVDLKTQVKVAHWNVKGESFIALHKLFDEVNSAVEEYVDLLAERAVQLGGVAAGTARIAAQRSELPEYPLDLVEDREHVSALAGALAAFGQRVRRSIDEADDLGDRDTSDLFTEISRGIDKWLWLVEAHGQGRTRAGNR